MVNIKKFIALAAFFSLICVSLMMIYKPGIDSFSVLQSVFAIFGVGVLLGGAAIWAKPAKMFWLPVVAGLIALPFVILSRAFGSFLVLSLVFHAQFGMSGADFAGFEREIIEGIFYVSLIVFSAFAISNILKEGRYVFITAAIALTLFNPLTRYIYEAGGNGGVESDLHLQLEQATLNPVERPPDIIVVYLEGLERGYAEPTLFGDVYAPLQQYEQRGVTFTQIAQINGTAWSLAGIVASQCGVPLIPNGFRYYSGLDDQVDFMSQRTCLSGVLADRGYHSSFIVGSTQRFGGYDHFLASHPFDDVIDLDVLNQTRDPAEIAAASTGWVLDDQLIFDVAMEQYQSGLADTAPMFLSIETYGPHGSTAILSRDCTASGQAGLAPDITSSIACTLDGVKTFLDDIEALRADRPTVVMLLSDHLNHDPAMGQAFNDEDRRNTVIMFGMGMDTLPVAAGTAIDKPASMPDVFPTLLAFAGFAGPDVAAGLGRSLFSQRQTIIEEKGLERYNAELFPNPLLNEAIWEGGAE